jgi:DNA-binding HxlR family transcriptional regulator
MLIGNKWKILVVRDLLGGTKRFKELQRSIGCSQKVLTDNLRELENDGLVSRKVYAEVPPRVEYSMTKLGNSLSPILDSMAKWGTDYKKKMQ